jgi:twitching motility protein PilJ
MATISEPFFTEEGDPLTSVTVPIIIDNQFKGVGGVDKSLIAFAKELTRLKPYESANAFLVSRKKILVASGVRGKENVGKPVTELEGYDDEFFSIFDEKKAGFKRIFRPRNNAYAFYVYEKNERSGWTIAMSVVEDEILRPINKTILHISIGAAVALLLSIGFIFFLSNLVIVKPINNIMNLFSEIGMGNFDARAEVKNHDELGIMAESLNAMLDNTLSLIQSREERNALEGSIMKLLEEISAFTEGDLTARAEVTEDITGAIADSFNLMAEKIGQLVRQVSTVAGQVTDTSLDVYASTEKLVESSTDQATQIIEAVHTINTMADTIREVANNAVQSAQVSGQSTMNAKEGAEAVDKTNESMTAIRENVQETARAIKRLGESSQEIGNIVQIIGDIADRTSILALNASIQAAMAGDAGRGFAVVAEEVQSLAERSTNSAKQIDTIIKTIQGEITEAGASMDESIQRVVEGSQLADDARTKLEEIQTISAQVAELIHSIAQASEAQAQTSEKTSKTMEKIGQISSNTSQASLETASQMNDLKQIADKLTETISAFKIDVA